VNIRIGWAILALTIVPAGASLAQPAELHATMNRVTQDGTGATVGTVTVTLSTDGAVFKLDLKGLPVGPHGFHVHENGECGPINLNGVRIPGGAAGAHWDPDQTYKHEGPMGTGHLGDLPVLDVGADGTATQSLTAPRIRTLDGLKGHALVIQSGGDNYSDQPVPDGGGGSRLACGVLG
jgi:superoxide dismutase, Cu-Zn family